MEKNKRFNLIFGLSSGIVLIVYIILTKGWEDLINQLSNLRYSWIIAGCTCMLFYWIFEGKTLHTIMKSISGKHKFKDAFKITMIGQFFNAITPFASGGQPAQLYSLTKNGINAGSGGSILMIKFIIYQSVLTVYSLILILWKAPFFQARMNNLFYLIAVGFIVNASVIGLLIIFSRYRKLTHKIINTFSKMLIKVNLVKNIEKFEKSIDANLDKFHENVIVMKKNKILMIKLIIYTTIQLTLFYLIPYCIYQSFGMRGVRAGNMIAANAFVMMLTSFIPLPGAAGGAEGGFYMFFSLFFRRNNIMSGILLWRVLTFYSCIIFGAYAVMAASGSKKTYTLIENK